MNVSPTRRTLVCLAYVSLHLAAQLSARLFEIAPGISIWYPPCGLALSLLVMLGPRYAWVVFGANVLGAVLVPGLPVWWAPLVFPALITSNYGTIAWFVRRISGSCLLPGNARQTLVFAGTLVSAPLALAVLGSLLARRIGLPSTESFRDSVVQWWLGDVSGLLTVVPLAMVFVYPWLKGQPHPVQHWRWEWAFLVTTGLEAAALLGSLWLVFGPWMEHPHTALYLCFLPLIWTSLRHGLPGATLATLALVMGALIGANHQGTPEIQAQIVSFLLFGLAVAVLGLGLGSVVTRRDEIEAELRSGRARFDRVISGSQVGVWDWNVPAGEIVYNDRCREMLRQPQKLTRNAWESAIHAGDRDRIQAALDQHLRGESALYECEYRIRTLDGRWRWIHSRGSIVQRTPDGRPELVSGTHLDITDAKIAESSARQLRTIVETTTDFVLMLDAHGRVLYANPALLALLGRTEMREIEGQPFTTVFPPETAPHVQTNVIPAALANSSSPGELTLIDVHQRRIPTSFLALRHQAADEEAPVLSFVMRDITAQKEAEAANLEKERRILQIQKAESLGVLAGGIAHDFNNLLTAIFGNAALLREDLPNGANAGPIRQIEIAAGRAAELCKNMVAFSGKVHLSMENIDLNALVRESRELIRATISRKIALVTDLADSLPRLQGSGAQLEQVIINLALNANEAIGDSTGTIIFRTYTHDIVPASIRANAEVRNAVAGSYVALEVEDTGSGVPESLRSKIFEPFFTTKPNGHGLGLAGVKSIVRAHRGTVEVRNGTARGAIFRILLPALAPAAIAAIPPIANDTFRGSGLALIVDDEEIVRTVVARLIERLGFETITAADGAEGLARFREQHAKLRFVLTDLTMPRMNGDQAITEMRRVDARIPMILMSGYPEKMSADHFALANPSALLVKPLRLDVLTATLRQLLGTQ